MSRRFTPERIAGLRRLLADLPPYQAEIVRLDTRLVRTMATDALHGAEAEAELDDTRAERDALQHQRDALRDAVRAYLAVDGSDGCWNAVEAYAARAHLRSLLGGE